MRIIIAEDEERSRRGIAARMGGARREGHFDVARNLLKRNRPIDEIVEDTGLTREEIEGLS
ncbi:MAG: hypothetical protein FWG94_08935 [Oscillospiraceae bacterium]|nr:hypothetical protein [Oscillospiraceae bacterium]